MNFKQLFKESSVWAYAFFILIIATYFIYLPGTHGIFLLDDIPNLSPMGKYPELSFWDNFWLFLLEGFSGPTGRPVSLASFYLHDSIWPTNASGFIKTNILIHLLNGVLVFWFSLKLSKLLNLSNPAQMGFVFIASTFWLLHPMQSTTVLYVIQRMTELSATFMLIGLIFYLYGREKLSNNPTAGFLTLFFGVGLSLLLSILSKENGILLVAYILVIEYFLLRPLTIKPPKYFLYWLIPAVILPFILLIVYLGIKTNPDSYALRNFSLIERLLTEPRILFDYLHHIFLPNVGGMTLYHDDYTISKNLLSPWTTIPSVLGIIILVLASFLLRLKAPFIAFAIAWFFMGHILESTVLPLELYFEHRNYLPILGIGIAIAWYAIKYLQSKKLAVLILVGGIFSFNSFMVLQNATLWGKPLELITNWYINHPDSERARQSYLLGMKLHGLPPNLLKDTTNKNQRSMFYTAAILEEVSDACINNTLDNKILRMATDELKKNIIHVTSITNLLSFFENWRKGICNDINSTDMEDFLLKLASFESTKKTNKFASIVHYSLSIVYKDMKNLDKTIVNLRKAYYYYPTVETIELQAYYLFTAGLYEEALKVLKDTSKLESGFRARIAFMIKQKKLNNIKALIQTKNEN